jgi:predicted PurR-regulated permease PerM
LTRRGERWSCAFTIHRISASATLLLLVAGISAAFVAMIRAFLLTILLAAIFAGLSHPVYQWLLGRLRGREALAAIATLVLLLALVIAPLLAVLGAGANEALRITETIRPSLQQLVDQPGEFDSRLRTVPGYQHIEPYATNLIQGRDLTGSVQNRSITSSRVEAEYACTVQHSVIGVTSI